MLVNGETKNLSKRCTIRNDAKINLIGDASTPTWRTIHQKLLRVSESTTEIAYKLKTVFTSNVDQKLISQWWQKIF